jgi:hypothetical protein
MMSQIIEKKLYSTPRLETAILRVNVSSTRRTHLAKVIANLDFWMVCTAVR